jgi:hypothetical protein
MNAWIVRFESEHMAQQAVFEPHPEAVIGIAPSGEEIACLVASRG